MAAWQRKFVLVLQDIKLYTVESLTCMRKQCITKAFTVVLNFFSSVVYICIFSNNVLGFYKGGII